jgi:hypothetical protein
LSFRNDLQRTKVRFVVFSTMLHLLLSSRMVSREPESPKAELLEAETAAMRWALRDWITSGSLFFATACIVLWQNAHVAVLFDLSYILNTAERISIGQVPYRDFPLAHAPLTFLLQAAIIRLTGRVVFHDVLCVAITGGLGTVLAWRIALRLLRGRIAAAWAVALLLAAPLVFLGVYSIVPNPEYDCDCGFWLLVALWFFLQVDATLKPSHRGKGVFLAFAAGVLAVVPTFFKQNMGLPFLLVAVAAVLVLILKSQSENGHVSFSSAKAPFASLVAFLAGACTGLLSALLAIASTAGLGNYFHWTIQYAGQRRMPHLSLILGVFTDPTLLWTVPCVAAALLLLRLKQKPGAPHPGRVFLFPARAVANLRWPQIAAFSLLSAPFLFTLASLLIYDDADERGDALLALWPLLLVLGAAIALVNLFALLRRRSLRLFVPVILLAAILGTFLSQQLWGSTYGIWPLLILLVAELLACLEVVLPRASGSKWFVPSLAALVSVTLLVCGGFYTASEERLSYANLPDGPAAHSVFPALAGLATPGSYVPEIDELLRYAQANIPLEDGIVLVPGEEPFYFANGRSPRFPVPFFDPTIDPYSPAEIAVLVRSRNIRWLIVKTDVQTKEDPTPDRAALMQALMPEFTPVAHLHGYDVYRR